MSEGCDVAMLVADGFSGMRQRLNYNEMVVITHSNIAQCRLLGLYRQISEIRVDVNWCCFFLIVYNGIVILRDLIVVQDGAVMVAGQYTLICAVDARHGIFRNETSHFFNLTERDASFLPL